MKTKLHRFYYLPAMLALLATLNVCFATVYAQGTAFTYQGRLNSGGSLVNGSYDLTFTLYATNVTGSAIAGPVTNSATAVSNGLFTTTIDFGAGIFTGGSNWLQIAVSTNGANSFTTLAPRQQVTPTPYAIYSANAGAATSAGAVAAANVSGTLGLGQLPAAVLTNSETSVNLSGTFTGNGGGLTNLAAWQLAGNTGTTNGNFLGTTDNRPLEIRVGGGRAGLISPSNGLPDIVFGTAQNVISNTTAGASILGGDGNNIGTNSSYSVIGGGQNNSILGSAYTSFLGGGQNNAIQFGADQSFIGGGYQNIIQTTAAASVIAGGYANTIQAGSTYSFMGGGYQNLIQANAVKSVVGGGNMNSINAGDSVLVGGEGNSILSGSSVSVIVGGVNNSIQSNNPTSFIGGGSGNIIHTTTTSGGNAFIGGGANNLISTNCGNTFIGGGSDNQIQATASAPSLSATIVGGQGNIISPAAYYAFIGGGTGNTIGNGGTNASYAVVPGGYNNYAGGQYSFAAGQRAKAIYQGDFVWADSQAADFISSANDQFLVRAGGGVGINVNNPGTNGLQVTGNVAATSFSGSGAGLTSLNASQLTTGTVPLAQLPAGLVTNNEPNVSLGNLTLGGNLNLPSTATVYAGGATLLRLDSGGNLFAGGAAGNLTTTGTLNTAVGEIAMAFNKSGSYNTAIGAGALLVNSNGWYNTASGSSALGLNTSGVFNTADGASALSFNTSGSNNVAIGYLALNASTTGSENTALGVSALGNSTTDIGLVAIGYEALQNDASGPGFFTIGGANTAIGYQSLVSDTTGDDNTGLGYWSLVNDVGGANNTALGEQALATIVGGSGNIGIGSSAGFGLPAGGNNNIDIGNLGTNSDSGIIRIGTPGVQTQTFIAGVIQSPSVTTITITGGSDLAEPFSISTTDQPVSEGAVVVIDEANPGQLKLTDRPYDTRVAGVVSGANGIHPGIQMHQQGLLEDGQNVALTGRVYVQADASNGAIRPGDLLTTSHTPGHAMKVTNHAKAAGAILGKAMTALKEGQGMVLVLVTLQ